MNDSISWGAVFKLIIYQMRNRYHTSAEFKSSTVFVDVNTSFSKMENRSRYPKEYSFWINQIATLQWIDCHEDNTNEFYLYYGNYHN